MKKLVLFLVLATCCNNMFAHYWKGNDIYAFSLRQAGIYLDLFGFIGDESASMYMNGSRGEFTYANVTRKLTFVSFNRSTRYLVLNEYDRQGKYIGKFKGKCTIYNGMVSQYNGTFVNIRGGKVSFRLHAGN